MTRPKGKTDIHVFLDPVLADRLRALADRNGLSLTAQSRMLLQLALETDYVLVPRNSAEKESVHD